jgi:ABC-type antimicrobial peptide transport system permease subunit/class 3 adenylate cyclase
LLKAARGLTRGTPTAWIPITTLSAAFEAPQTATAIQIRLKPNQNLEAARQALQDAVGAQYIVTSATGGSGLNSLYGITNLALPVAGFVILLAGSFLVFNAFAITLAERRREIGQLRTLGMTRRQVLTQTVFEAALTALFGSGLGVAFGWLLGQGVILAIQQLNGANSVPAVSIPPDALPLAVGAGLTVTLAVTFSLAAQAARISPLAALQTDGGRETSPRRFYLISGGLAAVLLLVTVGLYFYALNFARTSLTPSYGPIFLPALTFGAAVVAVLPLWVNGMIALGARLAASPMLQRRGFGAAAQLATGALLRQRQRAALTTATLVISFMLVIALTGLTLLMSNFLLSMNLSMFSGQILVTRPFPPGTSLAESAALPSLPPIPSELQSDIDILSDIANIQYFANVSLPGVGTESGFGDQYAFGFTLSIIRGKQSFPISEGSWDEAERIFRENEPAIFLPELTARRWNKHPGDTVEISTLKGNVLFTVAAVGGGFPVISPQTAGEYFGSYPFGILFSEKAGATRAEVQKRVAELIKRHRRELALTDVSQLENVVGQLVGPIQGLFGGLTSLSGIVAALGIVVTLFASVLERQREIGTLRALGMSRNAVRGMVVLEAGWLGFAGAALGAAGGLGMAFIIAQLLNETILLSMGVRIFETLVLPNELALASLVIGPVVAMLAALYPADRAADVNPADAMRAEGAASFLKPAANLGPTGLRGFILRLPLAAKLSLASGLILVLALTVQTALRVQAERRLLEDSLISLMARTSDTALSSMRDQMPNEVNTLTPETFTALQAQADSQASILQAQFEALRQSQSGDDFKLKYLFVTDLEHQVLFSDQIDWIGRTLTDTLTPSGSETLVRITTWFGARVFEGTVPLENKTGTRLGYIQIGVLTTPVDNFIREVMVSSAWTVLATLVIAITLTVWLTRRALTPMNQIADAAHAVARGDLTRRVPETQWDEVGRLARSFNEMVTGLNEREQLRELFGRYVSREVQEAIESGRVTLKGERKTITCLYVDMRGSTSFAEERPPEEVMEALNQYFEVIVYAVEAHGGIVNRFVGDEAVCVFGAPTEVRDHADRALNAALAMREGLAYLNRKREALGLPTLKFGMGLNTGEVVAGATGTEERQEYTVIGDAMNLGARIQALNKTFPDYDILVSEFTVSAAKGESYEWVDLGESDIRGKRQKVRVWGLAGSKMG